MSISSPFIRRPVATSLVAGALLVLGIICYVQLPVAPLPQVDFPTIQVSAALPGASPETMASNVATPLERQLSLIAGVNQLTSTSSLGQTQVVLQFDLSRNIDGAAQDVQAAVTAASAQLQTSLPSAPTIRKVNPADAPIFNILLRSDSLPISTVSDYADSLVAQQISRIDGVGLVTVVGQRKPAIRIQIDPRKAAALGLQIDSIRTMIAANTVNAPKGQFVGDRDAVTVYANDQVLDPATWNDMLVGYKNGAPVRVRDVGEAVDSVENTQTGAAVVVGAANRDPTLKDGPAVSLLVTKAPGSNIMRTVAAIKKALPDIEAEIPPAIEFHVVEDKTQTIAASVDDVEVTLAITVVLVVCVIFLFLRNVRATLIPSAVIPVSLMSTAAVMLPLGFTLDNLSLMALTIAVGFVVDDAIVMVEVIWRRIEEGESPFEAALAGAQEVGFTILAISISLIAVFTPLMFMGGVVGRLMREFALTLSAAVLISLLLSLTLTPMMAGQFLRHPSPPTNGFTRELERGFAWLETAYARGLDRVMARKRLALLAFIATAGLAIWLYATSATGFFPQQDTGFISGAAITSQNSSYTYTMQKTLEISRIVARDPDVANVRYNVSGNTSQGSFIFSLRPRAQGRRATADQIIARLRPRLADVVGAQSVMQAQQDIQIGARPARAQYQYTLWDANLDELNDWAPRLLTAMRNLPELKDVSSDQQSSAPSVSLDIDRGVAGRFGISPADIDTAIYNQLGQRQVAQYFTQLNNYHVIMEAPPELQNSIELLNDVRVVSPRTGQPVPLSLMVKFDSHKTRSLSVSHQGQLPAATLSFNLSPGVSLGQATAAVEQAKARIGAPASALGSFQGTAAAFQESMSTMPLMILAALMSVYVILGVLYESYIHPLTILSTLPSAGVGALLMLKLAGQELNVIGIIAIILLIGIVKKNGIMIVDVALRLERDQNLSPETAVVRASHQRLRPILMTTACALLSGLPLAFGSGTGSEFRRPLGWAIVGGLLVSQVLTLFTTPVVYVYLDRVRRRLEAYKQAMGKPRLSLRQGKAP